MEITPVDLLNHKFTRKALGYNANEVDKLLKDTANELELLLTEKASIQEQLDDLQTEVQRYKEMESTLNNALVLAQKTADDLKSNARKEAELLLKETQERIHRETEESTRELEALKKTRERFMIEFRALLKSYLDSCESGDDIG